MKIIVYSTTTCPYCVVLKKWLDDKHVEYTNYMIDQNPYAAQMMMSQSGQRSVPFTTVTHDNGTVDSILGFDREKFEASLSNG